MIVLVDAATAVERGLVDDWLRDSGADGATVLPLSDPAALDRALADADDATDVQPLRVVWRAREGGGGRWVPPSWAQRVVVRREPGRAAVAVAEPATVGELRRRFAAGGTESLAGFVARQAELALHRAERALVGDRYKVPTHIVEAVMASRELDGAVGELARRLELDESEVRERVEHDLHGLVASMSPMAVDLLTGVLRPLHSRAWQVRVDTAGLARLQALNRTHPLVFLPSHRSYADPLLLADVLAEHDFPRNHVLGGDNLRFWPVGPLAKRAGIVFIRRSFGDDEIYKLAVREYFGYLLAKRFNLDYSDKSW